MHVMAFIDRWNEVAQKRGFFDKDCTAAFDEITRDANDFLVEIGKTPDRETLFNMFQIITTNFAYTADKEPAFRERANIRKWNPLKLIVENASVAIRRLFSQSEIRF